MFQQKKIFLAVSQALSVGIAATISVTALGQTPPPQTPSDTGVVIFGDKRVTPPPGTGGGATGGPVETE